MKISTSKLRLRRNSHNSVNDFLLTRRHQECVSSCHFNNGTFLDLIAKEYVLLLPRQHPVLVNGEVLFRWRNKPEHLEHKKTFQFSCPLHKVFCKPVYTCNIRCHFSCDFRIFMIALTFLPFTIWYQTDEPQKSI